MFTEYYELIITCIHVRFNICVDLFWGVKLNLKFFIQSSNGYILSVVRVKVEVYNRDCAEMR